MGETAHAADQNIEVLLVHKFGPKHIEHRFDPEHMERLLGSERAQWQDPERILDELGISAGMVVADIGSGPGFFTLPIAERVGPRGKAVAIDVEPRMLDRLMERAREAGLDNIEYLLSDASALPISDDSVDAGLVVNVLHEVDDPIPLLTDVLRSLRPGGVFGVIEWKKEASGFGPPVEIRMDPCQVTNLLHQAGFVSISAFDVGANHYGLRGNKPER